MKSNEEKNKIEKQPVIALSQAIDHRYKYIYMLSVDILHLFYI